MEITVNGRSVRIVPADRLRTPALPEAVILLIDNGYRGSWNDERAALDVAVRVIAAETRLMN